MSGFSQTQLDALESAIAQGIRRVDYENRSVTYSSLDEMLRLRDVIRRELGKTSASDRVTIASHSKGLG